MNMSKTLYVTDRNKWRRWLQKHHQTETEIWLIYYKQHSKKSRIPYDDAVEEAHCFGWIDSIVQRIDDEKFAQKFTPRKAKSNWSESNIKRIKKLIADGKMTEAGLAKVDLAVLKRKPAPKPRLVIPPFVKQALSANPRAKAFFQSLAPSYRLTYIGWIIAAKREETRRRRLEEAIALLEQGKKLGLK